MTNPLTSNDTRRRSTLLLNGLCLLMSASLFSVIGYHVYHAYLRLSAALQAALQLP